MENNLKYYIVRGDRSGVFAGELASMNGKEVELRNVRKLWFWDGACGVEQIAKDGVAKPKSCKFTVTVDSIILTDAIQVIEATEKAEKSIKGVNVWSI